MMAWVIKFGPNALIVIGALLSLCGAVWSQFQSDQQQQEIIRLNQDITNTVTGGDSYPLVMPVFTALHGEQGNITSLHLRHNGKHPVYDLEVRVTDKTKFKELAATGAPYSMKDYMWQRHVGTIGRGYEDSLMDIPYPNCEKMIFSFVLMARNGQFEQISTYQKIKGVWYTATRLKKNDKVIFEYSDKDTPIQVLSELN